MGQFNSSVKINADAVVSCKITEQPKTYTTVSHTVRTFTIETDGDDASLNEDLDDPADEDSDDSADTNPGPNAPAAGIDKTTTTTGAAPDTSEDESESDDGSSDESSEDDEVMRRAIEISKHDVNDHTELRKLNVAITNGNVDDDDALQMAIALSNLEADETPN